jgi:predicted CoA-binding protein
MNETVNGRLQGSDGGQAWNQARAKAAGLTVVMDTCMSATHQLLY